ncbi:hypothetical protein PQQ75_32150 [Paraburkholderia aspalathi]|uniref:hypothetical protein n=1 Tax=Paraburkholderia aspalathi TaxID=1324617 RepID=UPI0038BB352E
MVTPFPRRSLVRHEGFQDSLVVDERVHLARSDHRHAQPGERRAGGQRREWPTHAAHESVIRSLGTDLLNALIEKLEIELVRQWLELFAVPLRDDRLHAQAYRFAHDQFTRPYAP